MYVDWQNRPEDYFTIDIETDGLYATCIWVMCWKNIKTGETGACTAKEEVLEFFSKTAGSIYVGHSIIKFDGPTLNRLYGVALSSHNCIDTLVLSTMYSPSIPEGHSLDAWGVRMGKPKLKFDDWSHLSDEMVEYCHVDVTITTELFRRLMRTMTRI